MKDILIKFQKTMMAATYAEAGEWDTAREMTPEIELSQEPNWLNRLFTAITFAESGLHDEAVRYMEPVRVRNRGYSSPITKELGLKGVQLMYGTVSI
jgi:hypothetical protein